MSLIIHLATVMRRSIGNIRRQIHRRHHANSTAGVVPSSQISTWEGGIALFMDIARIDHETRWMTMMPPSLQRGVDLLGTYYVVSIEIANAVVSRC